MSLDRANYRPDIDGLRAIAIIPVVLFHAMVPGFSGGFIGVDIFFVISGYLITGAIQNAIDRGDFSILDFWHRRIRRLLPALSVVMLATMIAAALLFYPAEFKAYARSMIAQALMISNLYFYQVDDYFAPASEMQPLLHTWSLAVEEQFYFVLPLLLTTLGLRYKRFRTIILLGAWVLSFLICLKLVGTNQKAAFFLPFSRFWEMLTGSIVFSLQRNVTKRDASSYKIFGLFGAVALLLGFLLINPSEAFPSWTSLLPVFGSAAIIYAGFRSQNGGVTRLLSVKPLVWIGSISYPLYLWHWPIIVMTKSALSDPLLPASAAHIPTAYLVMLFPLMIFLSWATTVYIERPLRYGIALKNRSLAFGVAGLVCFLSVAFGVLVELDNGGLTRYSKQEQAILSAEVLGTNRCGNWLSEKFSRNTYCEILPAPVGAQRVLLLGDSHAGMYMPVVAAAAKHADMGMSINRNTCPFMLAEAGDMLCGIPLQNLARDIKSNNIATLVLAWRYDGAVLGALPESYDAKTGANPFKESEINANLAQLTEWVGSTRRKLDQLNVRVVVVQQTPLMSFYPSRLLFKEFRQGRNLTGIGVAYEDVLAQSAPISQRLRGLTGERTTVISPADVLCESLCVPWDGQGMIYRDEDHLTTYGAMKLLGRFEAAIRKDSRSNTQ